MNKIHIGASEHSFCDVNATWIHQHVNDRQKDNQKVCVRVILNSESVNLSLATPQCSRGPGSGRSLTSKEQEIWKIWQQERLDTSDWTAGNLNAFVKRVQHMVC